MVYTHIMNRFFIKREHIKNKLITFNTDQAKKLRKVLRMQPGDMVQGFDGNGWEYDIQLSKLFRESAVGTVVNQVLHQRDTYLVLVQSLPKNLKVEYLIQKATEMGIDKIVFFESEYSQVDSTRISLEKIRRWRRIGREAAEQSERMFTPEIELYSDDDLSELFASLPGMHPYEEELTSTPTLFVLDKSGEYLSPEPTANYNHCIFFVGPEGGFSPRELERITRNNYKPVKVSETILRAETAPVVFLGQLKVLEILTLSPRSQA